MQPWILGTWTDVTVFQWPFLSRQWAGFGWWLAEYQCLVWIIANTQISQGIPIAVTARVPCCTEITEWQSLMTVWKALWCNGSRGSWSIIPCSLWSQDSPPMHLTTAGLCAVSSLFQFSFFSLWIFNAGEPCPVLSLPSVWHFPFIINFLVPGSH